MTDSLAKTKVRKGIIFIVIGAGLWSIVPILFFLGVLRILSAILDGSLTLSGFTITLGIIGLVLIIKGIVKIGKRNKLSRNEKLESRIQDLEEKLDEKSDSENS